MKKIITLFLFLFSFGFTSFASAGSFCASGFDYYPDADGTYTDLGNTYNGKIKYENQDTGWVSFFPTNGNGWYMNDVLTEEYARYYDPDIKTNPWENAWIGPSPIGTTIIGDCEEEPPPPPPPPTYDYGFSFFFGQVFLDIVYSALILFIMVGFFKLTPR